MSPVERVITIYPDWTCHSWLARIHDDPELVELFGSDILPTAYTLLKPGREVRRAIEARHPDARVRLVDLDGTVHED